jgi:hypothetical protein
MNMMATPATTGYLVIGTGATAMAFVDTLLDQQPDATVLMVDCLHRPSVRNLITDTSLLAPIPAAK